MAKVIQIRGLPDDAHAALLSAAEARGMSLTAYVRKELEAIARRAEVARRNAQVINEAKAAIGSPVDRAAIHAALAEDRRE